MGLEKFRKRQKETNDVNFEFHRGRVVDALKSIRCVVGKISVIRVSYKNKNMEKSLKRKLKKALRRVNQWGDEQWSNLFIDELAKYTEAYKHYVSIGGAKSEFPDVREMLVRVME